MAQITIDYGNIGGGNDEMIVDLIHTYNGNEFAVGTVNYGVDITSYKFILFVADYQESTSLHRVTQSKMYKTDDIPNTTSGTSSNMMFFSITDINVAGSIYGFGCAGSIVNDTSFFINEVGKFYVSSINTIKVYGIN